MKEIVRKEIDLDGVKWEYFEAGAGRTFVLIPAFHSDINRFRPLVDYLSCQFKIILPHLPGISNNHSMGHYRYSSKNYAQFLNLFIEKLKIRDYLLGGFCLGGVIIVRMLEQGLSFPKHVVIFEGIYDANYIRLEKPFDLVKRAALKLGSKSVLLKSAVDLVLHDERVLSLYLRLVYRDEPNLNEVIKHQVAITEIMSTRAYIETAFDIFNTHLAKERLVFKVPTTLIYNRDDNLIDLPPTIAGMQTIFPNSEVLHINLTKHSPAGEIDLKVVEEMIEPLNAKLELLRY
jgi:pimeloyl-ACP methyl ester carboxylesterase